MPLGFARVTPVYAGCLSLNVAGCRSGVLGGVELNGDILVASLLAAVFVCAVVQNMFSRLLRGKVPPDSPAGHEIYKVTNPDLANGRRVAALKPKFALPWVASPDLSDFSSPARLYFQVCRYCASLVVGCLVAIVIACVFP